MSDEPPLPIQSVQRPPDPAVVETLEDMLALAKSGDLTGFAASGECRTTDGRPGTMTWECGHVNVAVLGWSLVQLLLSMASEPEDVDNGEGWDDD